jgi:hypothetical protein
MKSLCKICVLPNEKLRQICIKQFVMIFNEKEKLKGIVNNTWDNMLTYHSNGIIGEVTKKSDDYQLLLEWDKTLTMFVNFFAGYYVPIMEYSIAYLINDKKNIETLFEIQPSINEQSQNHNYFSLSSKDKEAFDFLSTHLFNTHYNPNSILHRINFLHSFANIKTNVDKQMKYYIIKNSMDMLG